MRLSLFGPIDNWQAPAPDPARVAWINNRAFAHRGMHGPDVPENSPSAFAAALERGFGIECDVQLSSDGEAMVFHDWDLDRLTEETGAVARKTAAQLGKIILSGSDDRIVTLRRMLDLVAGAVPLLIEVKSRQSMRITPACLAVRRALEGYRGRHAVMSFDPRIPRWFAMQSPRTVRGLVVTEEDDKTIRGAIRRRLWLWHSRAEFLAYDVRDLPSRFAAGQRARGLPLATWTVRNAEQRAVAAEYADAPIAEGAGIEAAT